MVKTGLFVMMLIGLILLVGCSQADEAVATATPVSVAQHPPTAEEPTGTVVTSQQTNTGTEATLAAATVPLAEPTPTLLPEPTATTISCVGVLTSSNQEGPFYSPGSAERTSLIDDGIPGVPIVIIGRVFDQDCNPIAGAKLDFWLADVNGEYDNVGYTLRGHLFTDENGNYALESIEPTPYTGRPPHIHVKVFAPDGRELLTTQMYFSGSEASSDVTASPDLLVNYLGPDETGRQQVLFNFIVHQ